MLLVPHDLSPEHLTSLKRELVSRNLVHLFTSEAGGAASAAPADPVQVVVVDEMGFLAGLYALADVAVVGGGWGVGIHNTLEPAAHGVPIVTGPNLNRFQEAKDLQEAGALRVAQQPSDLMREIRSFDDGAGHKARRCVERSRGAAAAIAMRLASVL